jgi:hypothetical protein
MDEFFREMDKQGIPTLYNNSATIIKRNYIVEPELNPLQEMVKSIKLGQSQIKTEEKIEALNSTQVQNKKENGQSLKEEDATEKRKDIKRNFITKQTILETKKIHKIKPQKKPQ